MKAYSKHSLSNSRDQTIMANFLDTIKTVNEADATRTTPRQIRFEIEQTDGHIISETVDFGDDVIFVFDEGGDDDLDGSAKRYGVIMVFMDGYIHCCERGLGMMDALILGARLVFTDMTGMAA